MVVPTAKNQSERNGPAAKQVRCLNCGNLYMANGPHECGAPETVYSKTVLAAGVQTISPVPSRPGKELVEGDRWSDYGDPRIAWERIAKVWSVLLNTHITPREAVQCMIAVKQVRQSICPKEDNVKDIEGYAEILRRLER